MCNIIGQLKRQLRIQLSQQVPTSETWQPLDGGERCFVCCDKLTNRVGETLDADGWSLDRLAGRLCWGRESEGTLIKGHRHCQNTDTLGSRLYPFEGNV